MAVFSRTLFAKQLKSIGLSQQNIQHLSEWMVEHEVHYKTILHIWFNELLKAPDSQKLNFLQLANEVIQNTKYTFSSYEKEFGEYFPRVLKHISGLENYEKKLKKDVKRILQIWEDRGIYDGDQMVKMRNILEPSFSNDQDDAVEKVLQNYKFDEMQKIFTLSPNSARNIPLQTNEVVKTLKLMKHPASIDAKVRYEIVSLPEEVSKLEVLDDMKDKKSAIEFSNVVNYALKITEDYNVRLLAELEIRKKLGILLENYAAAQKEIQSRAKERLQIKRRRGKKEKKMYSKYRKEKVEMDFFGHVNFHV